MKPGMTFRDKITLLRLADEYGHSSGQKKLAERTVSCSVQTPSLSFQNAGEAAGMRIDLSVLLWRRDYEADSFNYAVVSGKQYRINGAGAGANDLYIRLSLERE